MKILRPSNILIPRVADMTAWSVVACDQFTSEPEYWQAVYDRVGDKPSALRMILPEAELGFKDPASESEKIYRTMSDYLNNGVFTELENSYIYLERKLSCGAVRRGIIAALDLESYDWAEGTHTPVRATEHTVEDRLPPRVTVREKALLEMPHIMVFIDDPDDHVFSSVKKGDLLYDFELMQSGGHVKGYEVSDTAALDEAFESLSQSDELIKKYGTDSDPVIFAMGDGNHSIAAAKKYWEHLKMTLPASERAEHPARFALCEIVNIHDESIVFEPIHKLVYNTDPTLFFAFAEEYFTANTGVGKTIELVCGKNSKKLDIADMTLGQLIDSCERLCAGYTANFGGSIDYIHGDDAIRSLAGKENSAGIMLPRLEKNELFASVMQSGPFPKKSFSIGHGQDKRYYLECRRIK